MSKIRRVALIGHCSFDASSLRRLAAHAPGVEEVITANDNEALAQADDGATLLLINRVLEGSFDAPLGVALIRQLRNRGSAAPCLLISNFPDAQRDAEQSGAHPGFGKNELHTPQAAARLADALATL